MVAEWSRKKGRGMVGCWAREWLVAGNKGGLRWVGVAGILAHTHKHTHIAVAREKTNSYALY